MRSRGLTDSHPDIQATERQIQLLRRQASREGDGSVGAPNPAYSSLVAIRVERQANLQALQARKAALQSDISSLIAAQAQEPEVAAEAIRISRDYEVLKTKYDELLQDREEMRLRGQVQTERSSLQFQVVDPPAVPRNPAAPNRPILLLGVLFAGLAAGAGELHDGREAGTRARSSCRRDDIAFDDRNAPGAAAQAIQAIRRRFGGAGRDLCDPACRRIHPGRIGGVRSAW